MEGIITFTKNHVKKKEWYPSNQMKKSITTILDQFSINDKNIKIELEMLKQIGKKYYDFFVYSFLHNNIAKSFEFLSEEYNESEFIDLIFCEFFEETDLLKNFPKEMMSEDLYSKTKQQNLFMFIGILVKENISHNFLSNLFLRDKHVIQNYINFVFVGTKYKNILNDYFERNYFTKPKYSSTFSSNTYNVKIYHFDNRIIGENSSPEETNAFEIAAKNACKHLQLI